MLCQNESSGRFGRFCTAFGTSGRRSRFHQYSVASVSVCVTPPLLFEYCTSTDGS